MYSQKEISSNSFEDILNCEITSRYERRDNFVYRETKEVRFRE